MAAEVRTRRLVVVNENGFESIVARTDNEHAAVSVTSEKDPGTWTGIYADDHGGVSGGPYLSGGGGSFESYKEVSALKTGEEVVDYTACLRIYVEAGDERFHEVFLDREGLHFGG